ncbi:uncharacterized protein LOC123915247 [Trifolium pratense]|uniref:uncharacterized protein LOC123915247 n=1 Tax=Trifolium pratense TaxID=57577 RepID=UPI001E696B38|nr:uncharacterized protein LOC123915247 [Trifolium pratense]
MNEQPLEDTIMEVKEDFMLSPAGDSKATLRTTHFLKPIANTIEEPPLKFKTSSSSVFDPNEWPLKFHFNGWRDWRHNQEKWVCWVEDLKPKYESVWKKAGIFEAIMSTMCRIVKNQDLLYGIVEKWCCETNTFVFPFGEATITLEDVMVLGGYPIIGHPIFTEVKDQEMKEVEEKLIIARQKPWQTKKSHATTSIWMDMFIDKGSKIEHEAFLATWLSIFVFPHKYHLVKSCLFPIAVHLARGNPIALAPAVLASIYKDLTLFKKTIVDLSKYHVSSDRYPLEVTLPSPFYLVQIWVWERFKNLQPQPMLINHGDPLLFRWHEVRALKIDDVKLTLDSAMDDFLWRPYVRFADNCEMFYPNDELLVPFKKDLDKQLLSFVICLRVSELVGFESIEQYLPHRVAMQFGMDQDVPSSVPRINETKFIAWKNYCRPVPGQNLYFPSRFFEADVTTRYAMWWPQPVLGHGDFVKNIVKRKRSASSRKHRPLVGKANRSGIDVGVPPGFPPHLVDLLSFENICYDYPAEKSSHDSVKSDENIDSPSISVEDCTPLTKSKNLINQFPSASLADSKISTRSLEEYFEDAHGRKEATMSSDRVCLSQTQGENKTCKRFFVRKKISSSNNENVVQQDIQFHSDMAAQSETKEKVEEKGSKESDHEVVLLLKEQYLKNQEELARLARQQEEMLRIMDIREKRDEELRQLLTSFLRNQQPPSS